MPAPRLRPYRSSFDVSLQSRKDLICGAVNKLWAHKLWSVNCFSNALFKASQSFSLSPGLNGAFRVVEKEASNGAQHACRRAREADIREFYLHHLTAGFVRAGSHDGHARATTVAWSQVPSLTSGPARSRLREISSEAIRSQTSR